MLIPPAEYRHMSNEYSANGESLMLPPDRNQRMGGFGERENLPGFNHLSPSDPRYHVGPQPTQHMYPYQHPGYKNHSQHHQYGAFDPYTHQYGAFNPYIHSYPQNGFAFDGRNVPGSSANPANPDLVPWFPPGFDFNGSMNPAPMNAPPTTLSNVEPKMGLTTPNDVAAHPTMLAGDGDGRIPDSRKRGRDAYSEEQPDGARQEKDQGQEKSDESVDMGKNANESELN